jgi:hypothetical protein
LSRPMSMPAYVVKIMATVCAMGPSSDAGVHGVSL